MDYVKSDVASDKLLCGSTTRRVGSGDTTTSHRIERKYFLFYNNNVYLYSVYIYVYTDMYFICSATTCIRLSLCGNAPRFFNRQSPKGHRNKRSATSASRWFSLTGHAKNIFSFRYSCTLLWRFIISYFILFTPDEPETSRREIFSFLPSLSYDPPQCRIYKEIDFFLKDRKVITNNLQGKNFFRVNTFIPRGE